jgi:hypothetical protein
MAIPSIQDPAYAYRLAEYINHEFNERLAAFMARAVDRRRADEFQRRYDAARTQRFAA